ncbi:hypothetical protein FOCC_FOCC016249 [Frankliniella occidentalis]|nr:hypothetical protein FOCC_FOCC016249 [Frankliniella occidentalis]
MGSDHYPLLLSLELHPGTDLPILKYFATKRWKLEAADWDRFRDHVLEGGTRLWTQPPSLQSYLDFVSLLTSAMGSSCPRKREVVTFYRFAPKPWWSPACSLAKEQKKNALREYRRNRTPANFELCVSQERDTQQTYSIAQKEGWRTFLNSIKLRSPMAPVWRMAKRYAGRSLPPKHTAGEWLADFLEIFTPDHQEILTADKEYLSPPSIPDQDKTALHRFFEAPFTMADQKVVATLFADIGGAYPNVNSALLCDKLRLKGLLEFVVLNIRRTLVNRSLQATHNGQLTLPRFTSKGLNQGDIWSPLLYILFTADLASGLEDDCLVLQYADDIRVTCSHNSQREALYKLQDAARLLEQRIACNGAKLEPAKSQLKEEPSPSTATEATGGSGSCPVRSKVPGTPYGQ